MYARRTGMAASCLRMAWVNSTENIDGWARRSLENGDWKNRDLWAYVDKRDVARAFRLSIECIDSGCHILQIVAQDYWSALPFRELVERHYPHLLASLDASIDAGYDASQGGWDTRRAQQLLGWKSQFHWGDNETFKDLLRLRE